MNNSAKIVFSRRLNKVKWNKSRVVKEINVEEIQKLKHGPGKDMAIIGSASIVQAFINLDFTHYNCRIYTAIVPGLLTRFVTY